jgi:hypothetical protein
LLAEVEAEVMLAEAEELEVTELLFQVEQN